MNYELEMRNHQLLSWCGNDHRKEQVEMINDISLMSPLLLGVEQEAVLYNLIMHYCNITQVDGQFALEALCFP